MYGEMDVPVSFAGVLSMLITAGTILSSLMSDRLTRKFGAGKVTLVSVAMTVAALFGFSVSGSFWMLCLWTVPYGLGAGSVDAALNNAGTFRRRPFPGTHRHPDGKCLRRHLSDAAAVWTAG